jgi:hypothetical protein
MHERVKARRATNWRVVMDRLGSAPSVFKEWVGMGHEWGYWHPRPYDLFGDGPGPIPRPIPTASMGRGRDSVL